MLTTHANARATEPRARLDILPRLRLLAMAAAAGGVRLAPRGAAAQATPAGGGWTFTDDLGQTVALPRRGNLPPRRLGADPRQLRDSAASSRGRRSPPPAAA